MQEKGPTTVYRPYSRRLKCPAICRCHSKGSTFSSVTLRPWALVLSEGWTLGLLHGSPGHSTTWAHKAAVKCAMKKKIESRMFSKTKRNKQKTYRVRCKKINKTFRNFSVQLERLATVAILLGNEIPEAISLRGKFHGNVVALTRGLLLSGKNALHPVFYCLFCNFVFEEMHRSL